MRRGYCFFVGSVVDEPERAAVPVSPAADELVPEGEVPLTEPDAEPAADGEVLLVEDEVEPLSVLGLVPAPAAEEGEVVVAADDELSGAGAVAAGGGTVTVVDELDEGASELGGVPVCWRLSVLSQAANPRRHADTATISFMMLFLHRVKVANDKNAGDGGCFAATKRAPPWDSARTRYRVVLSVPELRDPAVLPGALLPLAALEPPNWAKWLDHSEREILPSPSLSMLRN
jgi:hypothetical protein